MIRYERLQTPREHLEVLLEPEARVVLAMLHRPPDSRRLDLPILDTTVAALRRDLLAQLELREPVILTGHQAEFFHAGVFAKTVAADALAAGLGGSAVFLTVDSDVLKAATVTVPRLSSGRLQRVQIAIPGVDAHSPTEFLPRLPVEVWRDFFDALRLDGPPGAHSALDDYAAGFLASARPTLSLCDGVVRGHAAVEHRLGLGGSRDVRTSALCATRAFRAFAAHLLLHAREFRDAYNSAQQACRRRRRVRSPQRPAPPLLERNGRVESPFWLVRPGEPRRRLFVAQDADAVRLLAEGLPASVESAARLRRAADGGPWNLDASGWQLRPRALALSAWARLVLADLFIHGIGGAKYDEMTDEFVRRFFGIELAPMCCVTATLLLDLPRTGVDAAALAAARHKLRDLRCNPQRWVDGLPETLLARRAQLVEQARRLRSEQPRQRASRRSVFLELRALRAELVRAAGAPLEEREQGFRRMQADYAQDRIATDREYFFALHARESLAKLVDAIRSIFRSAPDGPTRARSVP